MLAMTRSAADAVEAIVGQPEVPESAVLRIVAGDAHEDGAAPQRELTLALVAEPEDGDLVVEDVPISLDPSSADFLADKVLDAEVDDEGVRFKLYAQPEDGV
jgi:iron-sulfur cluster assembly protein